MSKTTTKPFQKSTKIYFTARLPRKKKIKLDNTGENEKTDKNE